MSVSNTASRVHVLASSRSHWVKFGCIALAAGLSLTACSSDDNGDDTDASTSASASASASANASASASETNESSAAESTVDSDTTVIASATAENNAGVAADGQNNSQSGSNSGAQAAGSGPRQENQDAIAIRGMVMGINQSSNLKEYIEYIPRNTCSRVLNNSGGWSNFDLEALDPVTRTQLEMGVENTHVDDVTDIVVNGTTATGNIVTTTDGVTSSESMTFAFEGNAWTFCK